MSHAIGYRGRRPQPAVTPTPTNQAMNRPDALDRIIDAGRLLGGSVTIRPHGDGYNVVLPVEQLGKLTGAFLKACEEMATLHEVNQVLRQQRDHARAVAIGLQYGPDVLTA